MDRKTFLNCPVPVHATIYEIYVAVYDIIIVFSWLQVFGQTSQSYELCGRPRNCSSQETHLSTKTYSRNGGTRLNDLWAGTIVSISNQDGHRTSYHDLSFASIFIIIANLLSIIIIMYSELPLYEIIGK